MVCSPVNASPTSVAGYLDDRIGELARCLLWHVVPDAVEHAVGVLAGEQLPVGLAVLGGPVEVAGHRDRRHADLGFGGKLAFHVVVLGLTWCQAETPPVVVDDDLDVVGVGEGRGTAVVGGIVERPRW